MAVLELPQGRDFDPDHFVKFLDSQPDLGSKWAPRFVRVSSGLPIIGNSKVNKRALRRQAWLCDDAVWWRPPRTDAYTLMTEADRENLRREFLSHGRISAYPDPGA